MLRYDVYLKLKILVYLALILNKLCVALLYLKLEALIRGFHRA